ELSGRGGAKRRSEKDCRVVDENVERPESRDSPGHQSLRFGGSRQVGADRDGASPEIHQFAHRRFRLDVGAKIRDGAVGAPARKPKRDGATYTHRAARHERHLAGQFLDTSRTVWSHRAAMSWSFRNWLKVRFITGFFVTVPAIATAWLLYVFW